MTKVCSDPSDAENRDPLDLPQPVPRASLLPHPPIEHASLIYTLAGSLAAQPLYKYSNSATEFLSHCHFFLQGMKPTCRISDFVYLYALLVAHRGVGGETCMDVLVTSADVKLRP